MASEGLISAYCEGFGFQGWIFRFVSVLGPRYTHGHVFDFFRKLSVDPTRLTVLGDGSQRKSYMHVQDCVDGLLLVTEKAQDKVNIFNLGVDGYCAVSDSIGWICDYLKLSPRLEFTGGNRGWIGDNPFIYLDTKRVTSLGWKPTFSIEEGVRDTLRWLKDNQWVYALRD
jgi:UDP-glucose 4-epimerase